MASKYEFTQDDFNRMSKSELVELAESLHIKTQNLTKPQLIKQILGLPASITEAQLPQIELKQDTIEVFADTIDDVKGTAQWLGIPQPTDHKSQFISESQLKYNLELKRMEIEERARRAQMKFEERKAKLEFDLRVLEINSRARPSPDNRSTFKVETAAKLLPKLGSEHELKVYLITFRKIATLNNWPKEQWSEILQTHLKGKAMRIFAELPDSVIQDFDQLQAALLAAYELSPEHYRKKFRDIRKSDSENYVDFAFKMQNFFKRWLQSLNSYDDVDKLRQTLLIEQFLQTVSVELKIWLVDQKPKTIDDVAKLADQYVALRKHTTLTQQSSTDT